MKTFGFTTALSYLLQGKKVRRHDWHRESWINIVNDEIFSGIVDEAMVDYFHGSSSSDILADDWELVE